VSKRILLTGVFGPFGVDDAYGRKESLMELFHNQVTKVQGIASLRFHHRSFGLYFLAENIQAPTVVLDFPSRSRFIKELKQQRYDAVGISFIVPNISKAKEMARLVRIYQPHAEIILGGHGAAIDDIEKIIDCDHVVRGEGLRWLRRYLGEFEHAPIRHPVFPSAENKRIYGTPAPGTAGLLVPGVGCVNGCRFCATSHFFGRKYTSYFDTGEELYREAVRIADALGTNDMFVMDENFFKNTERAAQMLDCMVRDQRPLTLMCFSSAEAIEAFGVTNLARLGVTFLWIGAESKQETYQKNAGRDLKQIIKDLRDHGIYVLVSGILFSEHHTKENIDEDIRFIIDLEGVYTQFMMLTPLPGTALYRQYKKEGRIDWSVPYEDWHGQKILNYSHPHFTREESTEYLARAFQMEYDQLSSSVYRMLDTSLRGYVNLSRLGQTEPWLAVRAEQMRASAQDLRLLIPAMRRFAHDALERSRVNQIEKRCDQVLGPLTPKMRAMQVGARVLAEVENLRAGLVGNLRQPHTMRTTFHWQSALDVAKERARVHLPAYEEDPNALGRV